MHTQIRILTLEKYANDTEIMKKTEECGKLKQTIETNNSAHMGNMVALALVLIFSFMIAIAKIALS